MPSDRENAMARLWHYSKGGERLGPVPEDELKAMAADGRLSPDDMIWRAGMKNWAPARTAKGLFASTTVPPPLPSGSAAPPPLPAPSGPPPVPDVRATGDHLDETDEADETAAVEKSAEGVFYPGWGKRAQELCDLLAARYGPEEYEMQTLTVDEDGRVFQMRTGHSAKWKRVLSQVAGLENAVTVTMKPEGDGLGVTVGGGKWLEKAAVAGFATFVALGALIIPVGIGMWKQKKLLKSVADVIDRHVRQSSGRR
jgi:hypothetical protein